MELLCTQKEIRGPWQDVDIYLADITGKIVLSKNVNLINGITQVMIDDLDLSKGIYMISLNGGLQLKPVKVIVK